MSNSLWSCLTLSLYFDDVRGLQLNIVVCLGSNRTSNGRRIENYRSMVWTRRLVLKVIRTSLPPVGYTSAQSFGVYPTLDVGTVEVTQTPSESYLGPFFRLVGM